MTDSDGAGPGPVPAHCPSIKPGGREWLWPAAGVVQAEDHHDGTVTLQVTQAAGRSRRRPGRRARGSAAPPMSRPGPCRPSIAWLPSVQAPPVDHRTSRPATPGRANLRPAAFRRAPRASPASRRSDYFAPSCLFLSVPHPTPSLASLMVGSQTAGGAIKAQHRPGPTRPPGPVTGFVLIPNNCSREFNPYGQASSGS